ncbi:choice-of-anchor X domain-containing protein, partial [Microbispora sp. H10836]|uniref:DUF7379 domain-containing protein n=1 Tax=Microbispora sp. H10836 TaxID=2729106 RepID=UPI0014753DA6
MSPLAKRVSVRRVATSLIAVVVSLITAMVGSLAISSPALSVPVPASSGDANAAADTEVKLIRLADLHTSYGQVKKINNKGQVAGSIGGPWPEGFKAALFSQDGNIDIHSLFSNPDNALYESIGYDVNDDGTVVGHVDNGPGKPTSFVYKDGAVTFLEPAPAGDGWRCCDAAVAINDKGQIAGTHWVRDPDGSVLELIKPEDLDEDWGNGKGATEGRSLNNFGSVVGVRNTGNGHVAFRTKPGEPVQVPRDLLPYDGGWDHTEAYDINDNYEVAGFAEQEDADGGAIPIIWDANREPHVQHTDYGGKVYAINNAGIGVGVKYAADGTPRAALYLDGRPVDLTDLVRAAGWDVQLRYATGINDRNQIAVIGRYANLIRDYAFLLDLGGQPVVTSVKLETKKYPSNDWSEAASVTDGDPARLIVSVTNPSTLPVTVQLKLSKSPNPGEAVPGTPLPVEPVSVDLEPHEAVDVPVKWDTRGVAWDAAWENGKSNLELYVKARLYVGGAEQGFAESASILTRPKPVVLVHGWKSNAQDSWGNTHEILKSLHPNGASFAVGDGQFGPDGGTLNTGTEDPIDAISKRTNTLEQNAKEMAKYIENVRTRTGAWHVDVIAHSMGGLIARQYIQGEMPSSPDYKPVVNRMLQMGTPNRGTPCADMVVQAAAHGVVPNAPATYENTTAYVRNWFNKNYMNLKGVTPSNLAGEGFVVPCLSQDHMTFYDGDLIVPLWSAAQFYTDTPRTGTIHTSMTDSEPDFQAYVKPRLASVPGKAAGPSLPGLTEGVGGTSASDTPARLAATATDDGGADGGTDAGSIFATPSTVVEPGKTVSVPLDVPQGTAFGVTGSLLPPTVGLLLRDPSGKTAAQYAAGGDEAKQPIQALGVVSPQAGAWKLEITNTASEPVTADLGAWVAGNPVKVTVKVGRPAEDGRITVTGAVTDEGQPVTGVPVQAIVIGEDGARVELPLKDDGDSGDGAADDGVYGAASESLADGVYAVTVKADTAKGLRTAFDVIEVKKPDTREFELTLSAGSGGSVSASPAQDTYRAGTKVKVIATPDAGRVPIGWVVDGEERGAGPLTLTMDRAHTVEARFGTYKVTEIGSLPGGDASRTDVWSLNDSGQVAATVTGEDGKKHAVRWQDGAFTDLGGLACTDGAVKCEAGAAGVNEAGDVSGWAVTSVNGHNSRHAVVFRNDGPVTDLQPGDSAADGSAATLNDNGQAFGYTSPGRYAMWDRGARTAAPPDYVAGLSYKDEAMQNWGAPRLNAWGAVSGSYALSRETDGTARDTGPAVYADGVLTKLLGTVDGCAQTAGRASDINDAGLVVGTLRCGAHEGKTIKRAHAWRDGKPADLGIGEAAAVSDNELVVGFEQGPSLNSWHRSPVMWVDGTKYPLKDLLSRPWCPEDASKTTQPCMGMSYVRDVNSSGQILMQGFVRDRAADSDGFTESARSFLLSPTTAQADLQVTAEVSVSEPGPGSKVTWTATVTNKGDGPATDVRLDVLLPDALAGAAVCYPWRGKCAPIKGGFRNTVKVLEPGWSARVEVTSAIPADAADGTELKVQAFGYSLAVA